MEVSSVVDYDFEINSYVKTDLSSFHFSKITLKFFRMRTIRNLTTFQQFLATTQGTSKNKKDSIKLLYLHMTYISQCLIVFSPILEGMWYSCDREPPMSPGSAFTKRGLDSVYMVQTSGHAQILNWLRRNIQAGNL